jgi:dipeptidyl aminopeptidase/acylaminoacyl peptidase
MKEMGDSLSLVRRTLRVFWAVGVPLVISTYGHGEQRPFTVADDIAFTYFGDPFQDKAEPLTFSPDGKYFVVHTEHGRLDIDRPESSLRVYSTARIESFLVHEKATTPPSPDWSFSRSTYKDGPVITKLRWLRDSSGFGFLAKIETGADRLFLADLRTRKTRALTPEGQYVTSFDIRDRTHFVYTALSPAIQKQIDAEVSAVSVVGTDRKLAGLLSPAATIQWHDRSELWGVLGGKRIRVHEPVSRRPLSVHWRGHMALALSPDGHTVLTALTIPSIPSAWMALYPPPYPSDSLHIIPGEQDPEAFDGWFDLSRYVLIDLATNTIESLPLGPIGYEAGWIGLPYTDWSSDGGSIAVTNTFLDREVANSTAIPAHPCAVVVDIEKRRASCVEPVLGDQSNGDHEGGYHLVAGIEFDPHDRDRVSLKYVNPGGASASETYMRSSGNAWVADQSPKQTTLDQSIQISVKQNLNNPPLLSATDPVTRTSPVIWDPNPWLRDVELGEVSVYKWKDDGGRQLLGGLFKPPHYDPAKRYPLVIQTHGFSETEFIPSGIYPEGFAARELAAAGFLVLQVRGCPIRHVPEEGPCQVEAYDSAVKQLVSDGLVDPDHIGIVGFSRTCFYALEAITTGKIHYQAASITDGIDMGYLQYVLSDKMYSPDMTSVIGSAPFGDGLKVWLQRSPAFNMEKVSTPLLVVGVGQFGMLSEWEPYSTLWHLGKAVDLILLKEGTHPLTNPAQRVVSQGSTVDWMRFWLQGEEDPDPRKRNQYARWLRLRELAGQRRHQAPAR